MKHAPLSPSAAQRWTQCPGSHAAERDAPPGVASPAAELGTTLHEHTARCLTTGRHPSLAGLEGPQAVWLAEALAHARAIIAGRPALLETRLEPLPGLPQVWGTADILVFDHRHRRLQDVLDFKFGGWPVPADSLQLAIYAVLAANAYGPHPDGVRCWVIQPRAQLAPVAGVHYTLEHLAAVAQLVRQAVTAAAAPDAPRQAGEWCTFCRAADSCETRRLLSANRIKSAFFS
jgi:predicted RecB family nuclease